MSLRKFGFCITAKRVKVWSTLPALAVVLLLSLSSVATVQAVPMDEWEITVESNISLSADVRKGIEGAAEYIIREVIPDWEEFASIQCICQVIEQEGDSYRINMVINAERTDGVEICAKVLFEYDAKSGEYVVKGEGNAPTTTDDDEVPLPINATSKEPTGDNDAEPSITPPSKIGIGISLWSRFELSKETEKDIKDTAERLVKERINVEELGGVAAIECFVLRSEGEWYTIYARIFGKPLPPESPGASEGKGASEGRAMAWEAAFNYNPAQGTYEVISFSEVDNFLVPDDVEQEAVKIGEGDTEIKAFVTENAENNLTLRVMWINRHEGIVRLEYAAALLLNETHALYKGLTAYIDVGGEEVLHVEKHEGVWYAPGLKGAPEPEEIGMGTPTLTPGATPTTTNTAASTPVKYYSLGAILVAIAAVTLLAVRKAWT
ncbi:MAG: hypothetical protein DRN92_09755 [Thermoproteota archaeon]|nr:MAG: hypothetical protein DRN92_09755 [Candidatus Korarchaeota archaeon]